MSGAVVGDRRGAPGAANVVAIGESGRLAGFALAGVDVRAAEDEPSANDELDRLDAAALLILTPRAERALRQRLGQREDLVWVTLPD